MLPSNGRIGSKPSPYPTGTQTSTSHLWSDDADLVMCTAYSGQYKLLHQAVGL